MPTCIKCYHLVQGESVLIAEVKGWEWLEHVGIQVSFQTMGNVSIIVRSYNLKESKMDFTISTLSKKRRMISPVK